MPTNLPETTPDSLPESPRGPVINPGRPDRSLEMPPRDPVIDGDDSRNPNDPVLDPALLPIGDPAGAA